MIHLDNGMPYGHGFLELQVTKCPFHSGLRVLITDGYKYTSDIHCLNIFQVIKEIKTFKNNARKDIIA
jgi:hypothetical protein